MNTHEGYSKKTLDNTRVLLAGGGDTPLERYGRKSVGDMSSNTSNWFKLASYTKKFTGNWDVKLFFTFLFVGCGYNGTGKYILNLRGSKTAIGSATLRELYWSADNNNATTVKNTLKGIYKITTDSSSLTIDVEIWAQNTESWSNINLVNPRAYLNDYGNNYDNLDETWVFYNNPTGATASSSGYTNILMSKNTLQVTASSATDADTVDGSHASDFATSGHGHTINIWAGATGANSNAAVSNPFVKVGCDGTYKNQIKISGSGTVSVASDANGNITITGSNHDGDTKNTAGSTNSTSKLYLIGGSSLNTYVTTNSNSGVYMQAGDLYASKFYSTSDIRLKKNIVKISDSIRLFEFRDFGKKSYGFIAQELEITNPELVSTDDTGYKKVDYPAAICLLISKLENKIKDLENQIKSLKKWRI